MTRPRYLGFSIFVAGLMACTTATATVFGAARGLLVGFDAAALGYIAAKVWTVRASDTGDMRARSKANDPDHHILLLIALLIVGIVLVALWVELTGSASGKGPGVALAAVTLLLAWLFSNLLFALHYAHLYYNPAEAGDGARGDSGGLDFPGGELPDYSDFLYFAFVLGMTFQVSDVSITAKPMRRLALCHSVAAFLFDIVVVALSVSLVGDLIR